MPLPRINCLLVKKQTVDSVEPRLDLDDQTSRNESVDEIITIPIDLPSLKIFYLFQENPNGILRLNKMNQKQLDELKIIKDYLNSLIARTINRKAGINKISKSKEGLKIYLRCSMNCHLYYVINITLNETTLTYKKLCKHSISNGRFYY